MNTKIDEQKFDKMIEEIQQELLICPTPELMVEMADNLYESFSDQGGTINPIQQAAVHTVLGIATDFVDEKLPALAQPLVEWLIDISAKTPENSLLEENTTARCLCFTIAQQWVKQHGDYQSAKHAASLACADNVPQVKRQLATGFIFAINMFPNQLNNLKCTTNKMIAYGMDLWDTADFKDVDLKIPYSLGI